MRRNTLAYYTRVSMATKKFYNPVPCWSPCLDDAQAGGDKEEGSWHQCYKTLFFLSAVK